jgi:prepilin-type N-terminal cleavage/methylation domain-containing protein/prepilin-type processing-associated H-X9-DG protein
MKHRREIGRCPAQDGRGGSKAFTLLEMLIVVAIILFLTTVYWGSNSASRQKKQLAQCQQNLSKIFIAMQIYANDQGGKFPEVRGAQTSEAALDRLVPKYTVDTGPFICPASRNSSLPAGESLLNRNISYSYYMGRRAADEQAVLMTDRQVNTNSKSAGQLVFSSSGKPPGNNHNKFGGNLLFCDGHSDYSSPSASVSLVLTQGVVLLNPK